MIPPLVAIGYSTRALVAACCRAGLRPHSLDVFADYDTRRDAASVSAIRWKMGAESTHPILASLASLGQRRMEPIPALLFAGGMENWPTLVECLQEAELGGVCRLLGPTTAQLRTLRSPVVWCTAAETAGICFPPTRLGDRLIETASSHLDGLQPVRWLTKPLEGAGGVTIVPCSPNIDTPSGPPVGERYSQRFVAGRVLGAHFVCSPTPRLLGVTESYTAEDWPGPSPFIYRGSWGPLTSDELNCNPETSAPSRLIHNQNGPSRKQNLQAPPVEERLLAIAAALQQASGLRGWLQLDVILDPSGQLWLVDVNPRWSAGMEILVDSGACNPVVEHLQAFGIAVPASSICGDNRPCVRCGKAVVYSDRTFTWTRELLQRLQTSSGLADIPADKLVGELVTVGEPLVTVKTSIPAGLDYSASRRSLLCQLQNARLALFAAAHAE